MLSQKTLSTTVIWDMWQSFILATTFEHPNIFLRIFG